MDRYLIPRQSGPVAALYVRRSQRDPDRHLGDDRRAGQRPVDYDMNSKDRIGVKYYYQNDPVTQPYNFSQTGGFPVTQNNGSQVAAIDNTIASSAAI